MGARSLQTLLDRGAPVIAPGVADTLAALAAQRAGFEAIFVSGSAVAQVHLGRPDIGLTDATLLTDVTRRIAERVSIPVCADIDTGFGNAFNVYQTVRAMTLAGAACVQLEDQQTVKPSDRALERPVIPLADMLTKLRAAQDARGDSELLISARTDARYTEGVDSAIERAAAYAEAGADLVFVEGLRDAAERAALRDALPADMPRVFNTAILRQPDAESVSMAAVEGYRLILAPTRVTAAAVGSITRSLAALADRCPEGSVQAATAEPTSDVSTVIGATDHLQRAKQWELTHE
ncbi:MAG: isocitrate lyase/PEP mutase family protein [Pseudomonadota bacterium]